MPEPSPTPPHTHTSPEAEAACAPGSDTSSRALRGVGAPPGARRTLLTLTLVAALAVTVGGGWHHLGEEERLLLAERARLDPMGQTLRVQRSVIGHRDVTDQVLRSPGGLETERQLRAEDLSTDLQRLLTTLHRGQWYLAEIEAKSMQFDWSALQKALERRGLDANASHTRHALLLEQAVQVLDLLAQSSPHGSLPALLPQLARHHMPPAFAQIQALAPARPDALEPLQKAVQTRQATLAERLDVLAARERALGGVAGVALLLALAMLAFSKGSRHRAHAPPSEVPPRPPTGDPRHRAGRGATESLPLSDAEAAADAAADASGDASGDAPAAAPADLAHAALTRWLGTGHAVRQQAVKAEPPNKQT